MNILLTGSGGFIGRNIKRFLSKKYNFLCPRSYELDLTDANEVGHFFAENRIDFVIHCGTVGGVRGQTDESLTVEKNLDMVNNILRFKGENVRVIVFGSGAMYDRKRNLHKVTEQEIGKIIPTELYGLSKLKISEIVKSRSDMLCLNIFACYGYDEKPSRFPSYAIGQASKGETIQINNNCVFDYLFIDDFINILDHFIEHWSNHKIINVTPTDSISLKELADLVNLLINNQVQVKVMNNSLGLEYTGDNKILLEEIPDLRFTPMNVGLKKLMSYISLGCCTND